MSTTSTCNAESTIKMFYDKDADLAFLKGKKIAVIGFGSQGRAHSLNLKESGLDVVVGLAPTSKTREEVKQAGLTVLDTDKAAEAADLIMMLVPDETAKKIYETSVAPHVKKGKILAFAHGFNILFNQIVPPSDVDVVMIAPKGPGALVRRVYTEGAGVPCLIAVHQNASGKAKEIALAYARGIGGTRSGVLETTFQEETETDLFGEQAVLCGGASALVQAGFETLVEAGYKPEIAYFECFHELKLIVDLMYEGGLANMREFVSNTAEYGDITVGPKIITKDVKAEMKKVLTRIQTGEFAREFILENQAGQPVLNAHRRMTEEHLLEKTGRRLRSMMSWLNKKK